MRLIKIAINMMYIISGSRNPCSMTPAAWLPHPFLEGPPTPPTKLERNNSTISRVGGDSSYVRCSKGHPSSHSNHTLHHVHQLILSQASALASLCPRMTTPTGDGGGVRASGVVRGGVGCERVCKLYRV